MSLLCSSFKSFTCYELRDFITILLCCCDVSNAFTAPSACFWNCSANFLKLPKLSGLVKYYALHICHLFYSFDSTTKPDWKFRTYPTSSECLGEYLAILKQTMIQIKDIHWNQWTHSIQNCIIMTYCSWTQFYKPKYKQTPKRNKKKSCIRSALNRREIDTWVKELWKVLEFLIWQR